jgi:hypothetical protein
MPAHSFESLLKDLGTKIDIPNLQPTRNSNIKLTLKGNHNVVLQQHTTQSYLIISFEIAEIPGGRYRENIFREALKFNGLNQLHGGMFGYSKKTQKLFLFDMLPLDNISGDQVKTLIFNLLEKVAAWKEGIQKGDIPTIAAQAHVRSGGNIFGIRP